MPRAPGRSTFVGREDAVRPQAPDPARAALLVIDMQEYFRGLAAPVLPALARLLERARAAGLPVIYTQHGHDDPAEDAGMLGVWWSDHILLGTPAWALMPEVAPVEGERVFRKKRYSAFHGTDLDAHLRAAGIEDLVIAGVMTNLCCETTARDAFVRDYRVFFLADGTATAEPGLHDASLANLAYGFATILTCDGLVGRLGDPRGD
jgi:nicotinamidase-related amidase